MADENFIPPSDSLEVQSTFVPPSDAVEVKKKEPATQTAGSKPAASSTNLSTPVVPVTTPSVGSGVDSGYQWSSQDAPTQDLASSAPTTGSNVSILHEVDKKVGKKKYGEYLFEKENERLSAYTEMESAANIKQFLDQTNNYKVYTDKVAELNNAIEAEDVELQGKLKGEIEQIRSQPLVLSTSPLDSYSNTDGDQTYKSVPKDLEAVKTIGEAADLYEQQGARHEKSKATHDAISKDIDEVVTPLRALTDFHVDAKSGMREYGATEAFFRGATDVARKAVDAIELSGADDATRLRILKNNAGMRGVAYPEGPSGPLAEVSETAGTIAPYFIPGQAFAAAGVRGATALIGTSLMQGMMMGVTSYAGAAQTTFDEVMAQTGDEQQALEASKSAANAEGLMGGVVGGVMMPGFGILGNKLGTKILGTTATKSATGASGFELGKLTLPDYLKYTLASNAVGNVPFALQQYGSNKIAQANGLNRGDLDNVAMQYGVAMGIGHMINGLHYGSAKLAPKVKEVYQTAIAKFGLPQTITEMNKQVDAGNISRAEADAIMNPIISKGEALKNMPNNLSPELELKVLPIMERWVSAKKAIEKAKENGNDVILPELEAQEAEIRREAREKMGTALSPKEATHYSDLKEKAKGEDGLNSEERADLRHYEKRSATSEKIQEKSNEEAITGLVDKLSSGEKVETTPEENALYKKNKEEVDGRLAEMQKKNESEDGEEAGEEYKFYKPIQRIKEVVQKYKEKFGVKSTEGKRIRSVDSARGKRIADAFDEMADNPNDPETKKAYQAFADETKQQWEMLHNETGVQIELSKTGDEYASEKEMLDDIRNNNHLYVFDSESGFGDTPITDKMRAEHPLLQDSGVKDMNGVPLKNNDLFRGVHDIITHAERGSDFSAVGEENAWDAHSRLYSPQARRALTTETRGQNSWTNFGKHMRNPDGTFKKAEGENIKYTPQKVGLLPEEFSTLPEEMTPAQKKLASINEKRTSATDRAIESTRKALSSLGVKIVDDPAEYAKAAGDKAESLDGMFVAEDGTIYLNREKLKGAWGKTIVFHEGTHPVINIIRNTNKPLYDSIVGGLKKLASTNSGVDEVLKWAEKEYGKEGEARVEDETITETIARIGDGRLSLDDVPSSFKQSVIDAVNKAAKILGFDQVLSDTDPIAFKKLAEKVATALREGHDVSEIVGEENVKSYDAPLGEPTQLRISEEVKYEPVNLNTNGHNLSLVKKDDLIDFKGLVEDIQKKGQKVFFWSADQLGKGKFIDERGVEHDLDAGLGFALDPANKKRGVVWASSLPEKRVADLINNSDYTFIVSGSELGSKRFNKKVFDIFANQVGDFGKFKKDVLKTSKVLKLNELLAGFKSFAELRDSPDRKALLNIIEEQKAKQTDLSNVLRKHRAFLDYEKLRDGFLKDNGFKQNDVMLVLKPKGVGGASEHSTYSTEITGEVIGVPDVKVNSYELMPTEFKKEVELGRAQQASIVAPYGTGIRGVQASKGNRGDYVKDTYYEPHLTESKDKKDYVFFHVSEADKKSMEKGIDSRKFNSTRTDRTEKGLQYGVASFYTKPGDGERMVGGEKYAVHVPKDKVYPMDTDPNGYKAKAESKIKEGTPFRSEKVKKAMADMAAKDGFEMAVGEWGYDRKGGETVTPAMRADALVPLKPQKEMADYKPATTKEIAHPEKESLIQQKAVSDLANEMYLEKPNEISEEIRMFGGIRTGEGDAVRPPTAEEFKQMTKGLKGDLAKQAKKVSAQFSKGERNSEVDEFHDDYVDTAKEFLKENPQATIEDFAKFAEVKNAEDLRGVWDEATKKEEKIPEHTSIRNQVTDSKREALGLKPAMIAASQAHQETWNKAMKTLDENPLASMELVESLKANPRSATAEENALLLHRQIEVETRRAEVEKSINDAITSGDKAEIAEGQLRMANIRDELQDIYDVDRASGTATGRALEFRKTLAKQDFTLTNMEMRKRAAVGRKLNPAELEEVARLHKKIEDTQKAYDDYKSKAKERISKAEAEKKVKQIEFEVRKEKRQASRGDLKKERENIVADIRAKLKASRSKLYAAPFPVIPVEILPDIAKLAKNYVADGYTKLEDLVDVVHMDLSDSFDNLSKREVRDAISRYGYDSKKQTKTQVQKDLEAVKKEAKQLSKEEDLAQGITGNMTSWDNKTGEYIVEDKNGKEVARYKTREEAEASAFGDPAELSRLKAKKAGLQRSAEELERRLREEDFEKPEKREPVKLDLEGQRLEADVKRAKNKFEVALEEDRLSNRSLNEKAQDTFVKWQRAMKLSGISTLAKLTAAAGYRLIYTPAEEAVGAGWSFAFPKIAAKAQREGGLNVQAEGRALAKGFTKGMDDAWKTLTMKESDIEALYGKGAGKLPPEAADFFGHLHGALKSIPKRAEFERSFAKRAASLAKQGVDVTDPVVQTKIATEAYKDANRAIFMQDNAFASAFNNMLSTFERTDKTTGQPKAKWAASMGRFFLPFVKVPTNIVGETLQYSPLGLLAAGKKLAEVAYHGTENLHPDEADLILRLLKKGSVGAAFLAMGYMNPDAAGGYFKKGEKRRKDDVDAGGLRVLGLDIPKLLVHNPLMEQIQLGATIRRVHDTYVKKGDEEGGIGMGIAEAALGLAEEVPFIKTPEMILKAKDSEKGMEYFLGELVKNSTDPALVQDVARFMDRDKEGNLIKRKPETVVEHIKTGIPVLREEVKGKMEKMFEDRATPTEKKTAEEKAFLKQQKIESEEDLRAQAEDLGIEYVPPKSWQHHRRSGRRHRRR